MNKVHKDTKKVTYDVRPGAILSPKNTTDGPYSKTFRVGVPYGTVAFRVKNMEECANACSTTNFSHRGTNAFTFWPDYKVASSGNWPGTCTVGHVREPYYQTLTPQDNGAISGFALTSLSTENHRFLFGQEH